MKKTEHHIEMDEINKLDDLMDVKSALVGKVIASTMVNILEELGPKFGPEWVSELSVDFAEKMAEERPYIIEHDDVKSLVLHLGLNMILASMIGLSIKMQKVGNEDQTDDAGGEEPPVVRQH